MPNGKKTKLIAVIDEGSFGIDLENYDDFINNIFNDNFYISRGNEREVVFPTLKKNIEEVIYEQVIIVPEIAEVETVRKRLKKEVLAVKVGDKNINEVTELSIGKLKEYLNNLELSKKDRVIADVILQEMNSRLQFLMDVGLEYITLSRSVKPNE